MGKGKEVSCTFHAAAQTPPSAEAITTTLVNDTGGFGS
jgi:hypothetical protein